MPYFILIIFFAIFWVLLGWTAKLVAYIFGIILGIAKLILGLLGKLFMILLTWLLCGISFCLGKLWRYTHHKWQQYRINNS